jgi:hypothetical protein
VAFAGDRSSGFIERSDDSNHVQSLARFCFRSISVVFNATNPCGEWSATNTILRRVSAFFPDA